ncbi:MAG: carboxypeptidase regulatory-like domain-containing protein, partial [Deltaproteobacteria bacterium]
GSTSSAASPSGAAASQPPAAADDEPTAAETGRVRFLGEAESIVLQGTTGRFPPGEVPAGTYDIIATFPGRDPASAGRITVNPGDELLLRCRAAFVKCVP